MYHIVLRGMTMITDASYLQQIQKRLACSENILRHSETTYPDLLKLIENADKSFFAFCEELSHEILLEHRFCEVRAPGQWVLKCIESYFVQISDLVERSRGIYAFDSDLAKKFLLAIEAVQLSLKQSR